MKKALGLVRLLVLGLALAGLAGCVTTPTIETFKSAPREASLGPGEGGLIIGLNASRFLTGSRDVKRLELWRVDPGRRLLIDPQRGGKVVGLTRGNWIYGTDEIGDTEYVLQKLPAGSYFLAYVNWGDHGRNPIRERSIAFTVRPGAVTYIGNFDFKTPWTILGEVDLRPLPRDPAAARDLLGRYPQLAGALWDQQPQLIALACSLDAPRPGKECFAPG